MNNILKAVQILCITSILFGCSKKPTDPEPEPPVLNKKIVLSSATKEPEKLQNVTTVNVDSTKLVIQFSNSNTPTYKKGDILIGSTGEGYLRKVESVAKVGNTLTITTSDASLQEAFSKLDIDTSLVFYPAIEQIAPINSSGIVTVGDQKYNYSIECAAPVIATKALSESIPISLPNMKFKLESLDKASKLEVSVERVDVSFRIKADNLKVKLLSGADNHIRIVYNINTITEFTNISMIFKGGIDDSFPKVDDLWPKDISLGTLFISAIPLHFSFNTGFGIQARFLVGVGANMISSFKIVENYNVGGEYINGGWNHIWEKSSTHTSSVDFKPIGNMTGDAKIYLKPKLKIKVADMIGPSLFVRGYVYGELGYPPIKAEAGYGLDGGLEFIVRAFNTNLANFQWVLAEKKWAQWSFINNEPNTPNSESPIDNSTNISLSPTLNWNCSDADGDNLEYDVYFSTSNPPGTLVSQGQTSKSFTKAALSHNTKYFWRVVATDSRDGSSTSPVWSFTTESAKLPSVTTSSITNIAATSASGGGTVTSDGGSQVTSRGVCWSTSQNPTISANKTTNGTGTGSFSSSITNLTPGAVYYVRAYATNNQGTSYGSQVSFTTGQNITLATVTTSATTNITSSGAALGGNVVSSGNSAVTERGVVYATAQNPTTAGSKIASGSGTGVFSVNATGLNVNTLYYIRAYAINSVGTAYGSEMSFTTLPVLLTPTVTTSEPADVTTNSATLGGNVTSAGSSPVTERGIVYSNVQNPTTSNYKVSAGSGTGIFSLSLYWLTPNVLYYARAYAINSQGTAYGNQVSFTTGQNITLPTVTTTAATNITTSSASSGGIITSDGGASVTAKGVCWSTSHNPTVNSNKTTDGAGTGSFTSTLSGLAANTTYYLRAYATNEAGTAYGNEVSFATTSSSDIIFNPNLTYGSVTDIDGNEYKTIQIGTQVWMAENLKTTKYANGNIIGTTNPPNQRIIGELFPKYQWPVNGDENNTAIYGRLYTWYAATDERGVCPNGWHLPTRNDWQVLVTYLGGTNIADKLMETTTLHWPSRTFQATNSSGFTAIATGGRHGTQQENVNGQFFAFGANTCWWSSNQVSVEGATGVGMAYYIEFIEISDGVFKNSGYCVRCVKN
ncbi:MAG: hypothetical protein CVU13_10240 [Bacteroidetes bacterium HGW-Bacteroidetes-8]|jgi:uncharacterized protein (TIGR02145 family)|nr:MAG: hypothetical protein CVU13_10240 [Bacteroidetes bacterium HGW-Bacteroidetes-8]